MLILTPELIATFHDFETNLTAALSCVRFILAHEKATPEEPSHARPADPASLCPDARRDDPALRPAGPGERLKQIYPLAVQCTRCEGWGSITEASVECPVCHGRGSLLTGDGEYLLEFLATHFTPMFRENTSCATSDSPPSAS